MSTATSVYDYPLGARTVQSSIFRTIIESVKDILSEANLVFDASGMRIMATDRSSTILVHLRLAFEEYHCEKRLVLGVNMNNFYKLIKMAESDDTILLYTHPTKDGEEPKELYIKLENSRKCQFTTQYIKLMETLEEDYDFNISNIDVTTVVTIPSTEFQKLCRDMNAIGRKLEIKSVGSQLTFSCEGDFARRETVIQSKKDGMEISTTADQVGRVTQGVYLIHNLLMFTKCTSLCATMKLYLNNDCPLIVEYEVGAMGKCRLCLAPLKVKDVWN